MESGETKYQYQT